MKILVDKINTSLQKTCTKPQLKLIKIKPPDKVAFSDHSSFSEENHKEQDETTSNYHIEIFHSSFEEEEVEIHNKEEYINMMMCNAQLSPYNKKKIWQRTAKKQKVLSKTFTKFKMMKVVCDEEAK